MHNDPQTQLDEFSVDTDVFMLLTCLFLMLPQSTTLFRKKTEIIYIQERYMSLGKKRTEALIG